MKRGHEGAAAGARARAAGGGAAAEVAAAAAASGDGAQQRKRTRIMRGIKFPVEIRREAHELVSVAPAQTLLMLLTPRVKDEVRSLTSGLQQALTELNRRVSSATFEPYLVSTQAQPLKAALHDLVADLSTRLQGFIDRTVPQQLAALRPPEDAGAAGALGASAAVAAAHNSAAAGPAAPSTAARAASPKRAAAAATAAAAAAPGPLAAAAAAFPATAGADAAHLRRVVHQLIKSASPAEVLGFRDWLLDNGVAPQGAESAIPVDLLAQTFSYLELQEVMRGPALVSRTWFTAVHSPIFWEALPNVRLSAALPDESQLPILFSRLSRVRGITIMRRNDVDMLLKNVRAFCKDIISLNVTHTNVTDTGLSEVGGGCRLLQNISLKACKDITDQGVRVLVRGCPELRCIDALGCNITDASVSFITALGERLRVLDLGFTLVTDAGLRILSTHCPHLESLELYGCERISDVGIHAIADSCRELQKLDVGRTPVTDAGLAAIAALTRLSLRDINLRDCAAITDGGLSQLAEAGNGLERIDVSETDISDVGVQYLASHCPRLTELLVWNCSRVTDMGLHHIAASCPLLRMLDVGSERITDVGLKYVSRLKHLETLELFGCEKITDAGVQELLASCTKLRRLNLGDTGITDASLRLISQALPNLMDLDVSGCGAVSRAAIAAFSGTRPNVKLAGAASVSGAA